MEFKVEKIDGEHTDYYSVVDGEFAVSLMVMPDMATIIHHRKVPEGYGGSAICDHFDYCEAYFRPIPEDDPVLKYSEDEIREFLTEKMEKKKS